MFDNNTKIEEKLYEEHLLMPKITRNGFSLKAIIHVTPTKNYFLIEFIENCQTDNEVINKHWFEESEFKPFIKFIEFCNKKIKKAKFPATSLIRK